MAKLLGEHFAAAVSQSCSQGRVLPQLHHGAGQYFNIAMRDEATGDSFDTHFWCAVDVEGHHGFSGQQSLRHDTWQTFPVAGVYDDICCVYEIGDPIGWNESSEAEFICQSQLLNALLIDFAKAAVSDEHELCVGDAAGDGCCCFDEVVVSFEVEESADLTEDDIIFGKVQLFSNF